MRVPPPPPGGDAPFLEFVPGTKGQKHVTIPQAAHFLQEDKGPEFAAVVCTFIAANPTPKSKL